MRSRTGFTSLLLVAAAATAARADGQFNGVNMNGVNMNGVNMNGVNMNGVNMNGVNMNGVTLGNITADATLEGDLITASIIDVASSCTHSQLESGGALPAACSPCAQAVDAARPYCGTWMWDESCVQEAQSVCKLAGAELVGSVFNATLNDGTAIWLRLDAVQNAPLPTMYPARVARGVGEARSVASPDLSIGVIRLVSDVHLYSFSWRRVPTYFRAARLVRWAPVCNHVDRDGLYNMAVAAPGTWADCQGPGCGGRLSSWGFDLSCTDDGALAKCIERMGYKPWQTASACDKNGNCRDVSLEPYLEACVRMVRADYCGDGTPHTVDGTEIDVYDGVGVQQLDSSKPWMFEALWTPAGAACMGNYRVIDPSTGLPFGDIVSSTSCYHKPVVTEFSGPMCALPSSVTYPGLWGGVIGEKSSKAQ